MFSHSDAPRLNVALFLIALTAGCGEARPGVRFSGVTMATQYVVTIAQPGGLTASEVQPRVDALLVDINRSMSTYDPDSELSRLNANPSTDWIALSAPLYHVLDAAKRIGRASGGAFDVTVAPLVNLWGFGPEVRADFPAGTAIREVLRRVGQEHFELRGEPSGLRKRRGDLTIDLSGIAKGYAVDAVAELLEILGVTDYLVEIGGEIRARGRNAAGEPWRIGIESPVSERREIAQTVALTNTGMASSGTYRNYFERDGVRYSHMIDPTTGYPVTGNLAGVTVIHDSAMIADAWATALMTLGAVRGPAVAREAGIAALFFGATAAKVVSDPNEAFKAATGHD
jgi:thiamine biosynthesis lipoprotein